MPCAVVQSQDVSGIFPFIILIALDGYIIYTFFLPKRSREKVDRLMAKGKGVAKRSISPSPTLSRERPAFGRQRSADALSQRGRIALI